MIFWGIFCTIPGEIRCYCNDASCVRTGYMCKSAMSRCFSQLTYERDSTRSIHGCAETLPVGDRDLCEGSGNVAEAKTGAKVQWPILLCCKEDMCNYMDSLDINIYLTRSNGTKGKIQVYTCHSVWLVTNLQDRVRFPIQVLAVFRLEFGLSTFANIMLY